MKILINDSIYVQKKDLEKILHNNISIPRACSFFNGPAFLSSIDYKNSDEFIKFTQKEDIEFLNKQDWIINFDDVKNLTKKELIDLRQQVVIEKNKIISKFNTLSERRKSIMHEEVFMAYDLLEYKINSIRDFLYARHGLTNMNMPEGIKILRELSIPKQSEEKQKSGIIRLIKTKFASRKY